MVDRLPPRLRHADRPVAGIARRSDPGAAIRAPPDVAGLIRRDGTGVRWPDVPAPCSGPPSSWRRPANGEQPHIVGTYTVAAMPDLRTPSAAGSVTRTLMPKTWCRRSSMDWTLRGVNSLWEAM